jgi:hypothetical protein
MNDLLKVYRKYSAIDDNSITWCIYELENNQFYFHTMRGETNHPLFEIHRVLVAPWDSYIWNGWAKKTLNSIMNLEIKSYWRHYDKQPERVEPKNNDGNNECFWCNTPTKAHFGFAYNVVYNICPKCNK